jgi:hypothetical protein
VKRIYHPFWEWEDIGMWSQPSKVLRDEFLSSAVQFTGNAEAYGAAMLRVLDQFPMASEHNLTDRAMNRRAWVGHAAAYLAIGCPEWVTREAWGMLTEQQRIDADVKADEAINEFEHVRAHRTVHCKVAGKGLPGDTGRGAADSGAAVQGAVLPLDLQGDPVQRRGADIVRLFAAEVARVHGPQKDCAR